MLHGYGDNAKNFIEITHFLHQQNKNINYFALDAPFPIANYPSGKQWFDIYPNNINITEAGPKEMKIMRTQIEISIKKILNTINYIKNKFKLNLNDCFVCGFSQGGMMTFELGNFVNNRFGGLAILSGRILNEKKITNESFLKTPLFISHGDQDEVLLVNYFFKSCEYLKKNKFHFEHHLIKGDNHTISSKAIIFLQNFIKKNV